MGIKGLSDFGLDGGGGSNIKSIQKGTLTLIAVDTNITISAIDLTKAIVVVRMYMTSNSKSSQCSVSGDLTTSTNLLLNVPEAYSQEVEWEVIEFNNVKSLQRGVVSIDTTLTNTTISSVDVNKTMVIYSFTSNDTNNIPLAILVSSYLTTLTNLQSVIGSSTGTLKYQIIEFN